MCFLSIRFYVAKKKSKKPKHFSFKMYMTINKSYLVQVHRLLVNVDVHLVSWYWCWGYKSHDLKLSCYRWADDELLVTWPETVMLLVSWYWCWGYKSHDLKLSCYRWADDELEAGHMTWNCCYRWAGAVAEVISHMTSNYHAIGGMVLRYWSHDQKRNCPGIGGLVLVLRLLVTWPQTVLLQVGWCWAFGQMTWNCPSFGGFGADSEVISHMTWNYPVIGGLVLSYWSHDEKLSCCRWADARGSSHVLL